MISVVVEVVKNLKNVVRINEMKEQDLILAELITKIAAIEKLLIKANVITSSELTLMMKEISEEVLKHIQNKIKN